MTENSINIPTNQVTLKFTIPGEIDTTIVRGRITWKRQEENEYFLGINFEKVISDF